MTTPSSVADQGAGGATSVAAAAAATPAVDATAYPLATRLAAEALGTFLLVLAGLGIAVFNNSTGAVPVGVGFGLALVVGLIAFGHISGGHFNPAVTLGAAIVGRTKWIDALWYVIVQVVGAALAGLVLFSIFRVIPSLAGASDQITKIFGTIANGFDTHSASGVQAPGAFMVEAIFTAVFVAVILAATSPRANKVLAPIGIGLALAVLLTIALPLTNGSINPARSTAVVFFADGWATEQLWLFWAAPLVGAAVAAGIFRVFALAAPAPAAVVADDADLEEEGDDDDFAAEEAAAAEAAALPQPVPATNEAQEFFDKPDSARG